MTSGVQGEKAVVEWLGGQQGAMLSLLEELVNIDGGSYDKAGVDAVGTRIRAFLESHEIACETIANETYGDALRATVGGPSNAAIMLMGHRDTVFPKGEPTRRPFRIENGQAYGPGVSDMKAGLVMNAFVLAAFQKFGGAPAPLVGLFTSDEEIGSPACRPIIEAEARRARAVFNSEPGRPSGNVVSGRKGGVFMKMEVTGKAAHSGGNFTEGISAIEELARKITALHAITDLTRGTTVNVGLDLRRADRQHRRALGEMRDRPALRHAARPRGRDAQDHAHRRDRERAGHQRDTRDRGRVHAAGAVARQQTAVRPLRRPAPAISTSRSTASSPAAARIQVSPRASARRPSARSARSAASAHAARISRGQLAGAARADAGAGGGEVGVGRGTHNARCSAFGGKADIASQALRFRAA